MHYVFLSPTAFLAKEEALPPKSKHLINDPKGKDRGRDIIPQKTGEIPGKHGKSRETRKKSREIPGHFSSVRIFITTALYKYMLCQP